MVSLILDYTFRPYRPEQVAASTSKQAVGIETTAVSLRTGRGMLKNDEERQPGIRCSLPAGIVYRSNVESLNFLDHMTFTPPPERLELLKTKH